MTEHNDLQHKLVNDVYAELGTISKHSQDVIDYLMRHGWIRTPDEAEAAARGEMPRRTMDKQELIKKIADEYAHLAPAVDTIINAVEHEGWLHDPDQVPGRTITHSEWVGICEKRIGKVSWRSFELGLSRLAADLGITIVPEPTNAERWREFFSERLAVELKPWQLGYLVEAMDERGVKAPGGDHE